ncbi:MAG: alpha/beta hydrolase [Myxococcales bacterium]|nr:alpha/beta hydrolase [Myxococcales bacterium]
MNTPRVWAPLLVGAALGCGASGQPAASPAERFVSVPGGAGELRVSDGGAGEPAVVFLHGLGSDLECWREALAHVRATRRAVAYDQRGHGASARAAGGAYDSAALVADLDAVATALGLERFVLVGHSLSGVVLTDYAGLHPERVAGLVYVDAVGDFHAIARADLDASLREDEGFVRDPTARHAAYEEMLGPKARPATRARVLAAVDRLDPPAFVALRRSMFDFAVGDRLAAYRGPVVTIEAEGVELPVMASRLFPGARHLTLPGVSHWLMLDDPAGFARALDAALAL